MDTREMDELRRKHIDVIEENGRLRAALKEIACGQHCSACSCECHIIADKTLNE